MTTREDVIGFLRSLHDKQFVEIFYEAVEGRLTSDFPDQEGHFVLADAFRSDPEKEEWSVHVVALDVHRRSGEQWVEDALICQEGACSRCGSIACSWAKAMICPVCANDVYGT